MRCTRYNIPALLLGSLFLISEGCAQKSLNEDAPTTIADKVEAVFDWSKAPAGKANTMILYLYPEEHKMMDYRFGNSEGGVIKTYGGSHTAVCHTNDDPYTHLVRNEHTHETLEIFTDNSALLVGQGISTRGIPRAAGTEDEPLRVTPTMIYGAQERDIQLKVSGLSQIITLYPEELVCRYTVEFVEVENLQNADLRIDATISSLAGGYFPGTGATSSEAVTHTFTLAADEARKTLRSEFLTFGLPAGELLPHKVSLYIALKNRTGGFYTFDVSDQVNEAPDPRNVTIRIPGLKLPDIPDDPPAPPSDQGGVSVEIDSWDTYHYDLKV